MKHFVVLFDNRISWRLQGQFNKIIIGLLKLYESKFQIVKMAIKVEYDRMRMLWLIYATIRNDKLMNHTIRLIIVFKSPSSM